MPFSTCVEMIITAAENDEFSINPQVAEKLIDLALTQKVHAVLLEFDEVERGDLVVKNRRVCFSESLSLEVKDVCRKALSKIEGIIEIKLGKQLRIV